MAKAFMAALKEVECIDVSIVHRRKFVQKYENYFDLKLHKWSERNKTKSDILINATPIGMKQLKDIDLLNEYVLSNAKGVIDSIVSNQDTKFIQIAKSNNLKYVRGIEISLEQLIHQFTIYTGVKPPRNKLNEKLNNMIL